MSLPSSLRPIPDRLAAVLPTPFSLPCRRMLRGLLLLLLLGFGFATPAANLFVKVENPGWPATVPGAYLSVWGDYDGDEWIDLLLQIWLPDSGSSRMVNHLYRNNRDGTFTRKLAADVGPIVSDSPLHNAACSTLFWVDVNNDGPLDLLVLADCLSFDGTMPITGRLYRNDGYGRFSSVEAGALTQPRPSLASNWGCVADYDNDGWLDVFILSAGEWVGYLNNLLVRGRGDGTFERVTNNTVALDESLGAWACSWADIDNDGDQDLLVESGAVADHPLYRNDGHGVFTRVTDRFRGAPTAGAWFGAWGDFDNDGDLDFVSAAGLAVNNGLGVFQWSEQDLETDKFLGAAWVDIDNDGHLDFTMRSEVEGSQEVLWYRNRGQGSFERIANPLPGFAMQNADIPFLAWGDCDNDGDMDAFVRSHLGTTFSLRLFRNESKVNHWLKVRLTGTAANRSAIGAKVRVKATIGGQAFWQLRVVDPTAAGMFERDYRPNFGLGDATVAEEVRIEWPSGNVTVLSNVAANQILDVTEVVNIEPARPVTVINGSVSLTHTLAASSRQWYFEGAPLPARTGRVLPLSNLQTNQAGRYSVVAQTEAGLQTNHVYVRVMEQFTRISEGPVVQQARPSLAGTWFDYDSDGRLDLHVANNVGSSTDSLYHNLGESTFTSIGSPNPIVLRGGQPSAPADFDNDGDSDLFVAHVGWNNATDDLYRNDGSGSFTRLTSLPLNLAGDQTVDAAWADYDRDGDVDLLVANGFGSQAKADALYRNEGNGTFAALTAAEGGKWLDELNSSWTCSWADVDADGYPDAVIQHGDGQLQLLHNQGNGRLTEVAAGSLEATGDYGCAWGDYNNDGYPDVFAGRFLRNEPALHRNLGNLTFTNVSAAAGVAFTGLGMGTWGDYDNDGFLDLYFAGYDQPGALCRNRGDCTFQIVDSGSLATDGKWRNSAVWADYDNNGFLDLFIACGDAEAQLNKLYRNNGNGNHWLKARLVGTASNRDGIGARIRVTATIGGRAFTQTREISGNSGIHGVPLLAHFGLGDATNATRVRIEWPSGTVQDLPNVAADQHLTITEPAIIELHAARIADEIRLEWRGEANARYRLQFSPTMKSWSTAQSVTADASGLATATFSSARGTGFFKVVKD